VSPEERFERIEMDLQTVAETLKVSAAFGAQMRTDLGAVTDTLKVFADSMLQTRTALARLIERDELQQRNLATLAETTTHIGARLTALTEEVTAYVADSRERIKQMEANLDALIRIITAEHSNGKGKL
jgi:Mg2+ and Co2+ transporter CorA